MSLSRLDSHVQHLLIQQVLAKIGMVIRVGEQSSFVDKVTRRMQSLGIKNGQDYYNLLKQPTQQSKAEWTELTNLITNTESYFFRDKGQFSLLKNWILPDLLARKKKDYSLRIWSAGCSTGEEPYSLAILLQNLIANLHLWQIQIIATDINTYALEKAKQGIYSSWSFRRLEPHLLQEYFHPVNGNYQIHLSLQKMVEFRQLNFMDQSFQQGENYLEPIDLIICRNVFLYFNSDTIAFVLKKMIDILNPGGYLLTGHAELYGQNLTNLETKIFSESIVYQKRETPYLKCDIHPFN